MRIESVRGLLKLAVLTSMFVPVAADEIVIKQEVSSTAGGHSSGIQSSSDGSIVAFLSDAPDLVTGTPSDQVNLFRVNLATGEAERISLDVPGWIESFSMSADAERMAICIRRNPAPVVSTSATSDVYLWTGGAGLTKISESAVEGAIVDSDCWDPWITPDGRFVFFKTRSDNLLPGHFSTCMDSEWSDMTFRKELWMLECRYSADA